MNAALRGVLFIHERTMLQSRFKDGIDAVRKYVAYKKPRLKRGRNWCEMIILERFQLFGLPFQLINLSAALRKARAFFFDDCCRRLGYKSLISQSTVDS